MKNLQLQNQFKKIESEFYLSKSALIILYSVSITGLFIGLSGWISSPSFLWLIPESYYIAFTIAALILLGLTLTVRIFTQNLSLIFSELKSGN